MDYSGVYSTILHEVAHSYGIDGWRNHLLELEPEEEHLADPNGLRDETGDTHNFRKDVMDYGWQFLNPNVFDEGHQKFIFSNINQHSD